MNRSYTYPIILLAVLSLGVVFWNSYHNKGGAGSYVRPPLAGEQQLEFSSWMDYSLTSNPFSVKFPVLPQHISEKAIDPKSNQLLTYEVYASETLNGNIYFINLTTYPKDVLSKENKEKTLLTVMQDILAKNSDNHLVDMQKGNFLGYDSLDFEISSPDKNILGKTFVVGDTLYVLSGFIKHEPEKKEEYDFFIHSFSLNPKKTKPNGETSK